MVVVEIFYHSGRILFFVLIFNKQRLEFEYKGSSFLNTHLNCDIISFFSEGPLTSGCFGKAHSNYVSSATTSAVEVEAQVAV